MGGRREGGWDVRDGFWSKTFADCVCWFLSVLVGPTGESRAFPELKKKRRVGGSLGDKGDSFCFPSPDFVIVLGWLGQAPGVNHRLFKHLVLRAEGPFTKSTRPGISPAPFPVQGDVHLLPGGFAI